MTTHARHSHEHATHNRHSHDRHAEHAAHKPSAPRHGGGHSHRHYGEAMLSVEEARERILRYFKPLEAARVPLLEAIGQTLAEDALANHDIPPLDNSAMDGYALQAADVRGASADNPITLKVAGAIAAGELPTVEVTPGSVVRIMTGAPVPDGADAVVPFEDTDEMQRRADGSPLDEIAIRYQVAVGDDIRPAGQDVRKGDLVLRAGTMLRPSEVGVLASLGYDAVSVLRRPVVAILATGNELLEPGAPYSPGMIYDSNSYSIAATVSALRRHSQAHRNRARQPRIHERQPARRVGLGHARNIGGRLQGRLRHGEGCARAARRDRLLVRPHAPR